MPSIEFIQSTGNHADVGTFNTPFITVTAASLLVFTTAWWNNNQDGTDGVTDTGGNTWQRGPWVPRWPGPQSPIYGSRTYWLPNAPAGPLIATFNHTGTGIVTSAGTMIEFKVPSTVVPMDCEGLYESQQGGGGGHGGTNAPFTMWTAVQTLRSPGLMVGGGFCDRQDMVLDSSCGFTGLAAQHASGASAYVAYAINPQGAQRASWTKPDSLSVESLLSLATFRDTAYPVDGYYPVSPAGRGANR